jgi:hypothetical protein
MESTQTPAAHIVLRIIAAVPGGYLLCAALVGLTGAALAALGMARAEAVVLAAMLGFLQYLLVLLWAFSVRSVLRLWIVVTGGSGLAWGLLQLLH